MPAYVRRRTATVEALAVEPTIEAFRGCTLEPYKNGSMYLTNRV